MNLEFIMTANRRFSTPIPKGYRIVFREMKVAGVFYRQRAAAKAFLGRSCSLFIEPEPGNMYDKNALKVIVKTKGIFLTRRHHIGYIPREVAAIIATRKLNHDLLLRLKNIYVDKCGIINVYIDILGLKSENHKIENL